MDRLKVKTQLWVDTGVENPTEKIEPYLVVRYPFSNLTLQFVWVLRLNRVVHGRHYDTLALNELD